MHAAESVRPGFSYLATAFFSFRVPARVVFCGQDRLACVCQILVKLSSPSHMPLPKDHLAAAGCISAGAQRGGAVCGPKDQTRTRKFVPRIAWCEDYAMCGLAEKPRNPKPIVGRRTSGAPFFLSHNLHGSCVCVGFATRACPVEAGVCLQARFVLRGGAAHI